MTYHSSASVCELTPHANQTSIKRRAQSVLNNNSIDPQIRAMIRYALETNDPWLAELVHRVEAGETSFDSLDFEETPKRKRSKRSQRSSVAREMSRKSKPLPCSC